MNERPHEALVAAALAEDLGADGDVTGRATVSSEATGRARLVARSAGVAAGVQTALSVFTAVDEALTTTAFVADGAPLGPGTELAEVSGSVRSILAAERSVLNLLTHLCGVATETARYVEVVGDTGCLVRDTRKTLPALRSLQKQAVAAGGGSNHRMSLSDALLVKDNHVAAVGSVSGAVKAALVAAGELPVQVEVADLAELDEALAAGASSVLVDNPQLETLAEAATRCRNQSRPVFVEASGNITLENAAAVAATGVDAIAVGALTHSPSALDIALDLDEGAP
jgi:nicotinate-nucleotide pyrophosphorylase (carboxylating)